METEHAGYRIGYARVSTEEQSLDLQTDALTRAGCQRIYADVASGARASRPQLDDMLGHLRAGDTVVVYKLDRLGRSVQNLVDLIERFRQANVHFESLTEKIDTGTPGGILVFNVFAAIAQFERDLIRERTNDGLAAARKRGRVGGRPHKLDDEQKAKLIALADSHTVSVKDMCQLFGISKPTYYSIINNAGQ